MLIPSWTNTVAEYASLLQGITAGNLPETVAKIPELATRVRDPKGMLLTPEQRIQRTRSLLVTALGLALVNRGWTIHCSPGQFHLGHGEEQLNPRTLVLQISDGTISKEAWAAKCKALGIGDIPLAVVAENPDGSRQEALPVG